MKPKRVLVVESEPALAQLIYESLSLKKMRVVTVASGPQALALLDSVAPDLIVMDMIMPDMSGFDVCRRIKENPKFKLIPVIFVTVLGKRAAGGQRRMTSADLHLLTPFDSPPVDNLAAAFLN
jgi:two-component system, cell cycle response regulator